MIYEHCFSRTVDRDCGDRLCNVSATPDTFHPISVHLGGAVMVLSKRDSLVLARTLADAVLSLPKGM